MENKNKHFRVGFSTILWGVMLGLVCAAPCGALEVGSTETLNLDYPIVGDWVDVYGTLNMYTGAYVDWGIYAFDGSTVNIYAGTIGTGYCVMVFNGANVTVYGTDFGGDGDLSVPGQVSFPSGSGTLSVTYDDETTADLLFYSDIPINLVNTAGGVPLEAELWVFPGIINRFGPLSKILAMVRLPEGITKDDIDSEQTLVLNPGGIEAACQYAFQWYEEGTVRTSIIASFDKAELLAAVPDDGKVGLEVVGQLNTGQEFYGTDTVRIVSWSWWRR